jgi:hypothetical protein
MTPHALTHSHSPLLRIASHRMAQVAALVADAKDAGRLAFVNLLPNYASSPGQTGAATYGEYVKDFVQTVKPNLLSVDHYPDFDQDTTGNKTKAG